MVDAYAPLLRHVRVFGAVEASAIVIVGLSIAILGLFNNVIRAVINRLFHQIISLMCAGVHTKSTIDNHKI